MVIEFPDIDNRVYMWARSYALLFFTRGQKAAGRYAKDIIPTQFHKQIDPIVKLEFRRLKENK